MKNHTKLLSLLLVGTFALVACGDDESTTGSTSNPSTTDTTTGMGGENTGGSPTTTTGMGGENTGGGTSIPELGPQIDRMGRPAVNTALDHTFVRIEGNAVKESTDEDRAAAEDAYNADSTEAKWAETYVPTAALQLGVLDSLDTGLNGTTNETACENQPFACADISNTTGACYSGPLANVLMNDRLWVRTDGENCTPIEPEFGGYLAVEANATKLAPNPDCGGRRPVDDVIERTYSILVFGGLAGFDDGITPPTGLHTEAFPYFANPQ